MLAVGNLDPSKMPEPNLCSFGFEVTGTKLRRYYWFDLLMIGGVNYGLGANLHSTGDLGGMWLQGYGGGTPELHPKKPPKIPNQTAWQAYLTGLVTDGTFDKKLKKKKKTP